MTKSKDQTVLEPTFNQRNVTKFWSFGIPSVIPKSKKKLRYIHLKFACTRYSHLVSGKFARFIPVLVITK